MIQSAVRVLLVEDDPDDALLTREMLTRIPGRGYEIDWANSVEAAREAVRRKAFDIALVDHFVDAENGIDFIRECISDNIGFPMILLTGRADPVADAEALAAGAADYLGKGDINATLLDRAIRYSLRHADFLASLQESRQFLKSTLDSLPCEVAILDENGTIMAVNESWRRFARSGRVHHSEAAGEAQALEDGVGVNYLEICRKAMKEGDRTAGMLVQAIQDVRDHKWNNFSLEYAAQSEEGIQWFNLDISRFASAGGSYITVTQTDVSENRRALEAALARENVLQALMESSSDVRLIVSDGSILYATPGILQLTGLSARSMAGRRIADFLHSEDRGNLIMALSGSPFSAENFRCRICHADKFVQWVDVSVALQIGEAEKRAIVTFRPVADPEKYLGAYLRDAVRQFGMYAPAQIDTA